MNKLMWILFILAMILSGCSSHVVYDDYIDSFRYKPESEWDYINNLGPSDIPVEKAGDH